MNRRLGSALAFGLSFAAPAIGADWLQYGYDAHHSANNPDEHEITRENVTKLSSLYGVGLPESVSGAPVYLGGAATPSGPKNLLFMTSSSGSLLAVNPDDGSIFWIHAQPPANFEGTHSSPALDPDRQYVYGYAMDGKVHKYAVGDGTEITTQGWPQIVTLKPEVEHVASALAVATAANGATYLYAVTNGYYGDGGDYQGHLVAIDLATGEQKIFNSLCSDLAIHFLSDGEPGVTDCAAWKSGIWGRPGAVYDAATDRVYISTSNGEFNANIGGFNWGDSILALAPDGSGSGLGMPLDSFTPDNYTYLEQSDLDYGAGSLAIIPAPPSSLLPHLGAQMGKEGVLHLINLDNMSGAGMPGIAGGALQSIKLTGIHFNPIPQPAVWVNPDDGSTWLFVSTLDGVSSLQLEVDAAGMPSLQLRWVASGYGSPLVANNILFHGGRAYDPATGVVLAPSGGSNCCYWGSAIVVDGRMYSVDQGWLVASGVEVIFRGNFERLGTRPKSMRN